MLEVTVKDNKGNLIFKTDGSIKALVKVKVEGAEGIVLYKRSSGKEEVANATDLKVWSFK